MEDYIHLNPKSIEKIKRLSSKVCMVNYINSLIGFDSIEENDIRVVIYREIEAELGSNINYFDIAYSVIGRED